MSIETKTTETEATEVEVEVLKNTFNAKDYLKQANDKQLQKRQWRMSAKETGTYFKEKN